MLERRTSRLKQTSKEMVAHLNRSVFFSFNLPSSWTNSLARFFQVATLFLGLFYKYLITNPEEVHRFFKEDSVLTRGDDDEQTKSAVSFGQSVRSFLN